MKARLVTPETRHLSGSQTLVEALEQAAAADPENQAGVCFVDRRERDQLLGWNRIAVRAHEVARGLLQLGVRPGDRIALLYPTAEAFFAAFFGVLCAGAVPAPLASPPRLVRTNAYDRRTAAMIDRAGIRRILCAPRLRPRLSGVMAHLASRTERVQIVTLEELPRTAARHELPTISPEDLALVQFSSGTTGGPKPVALTHDALLCQGRLLAAHWPNSDNVEHAGVSWLPLYHDMGLIGCVVPALLRAATLYLLAPEVFVGRPAIWLRTLARTRATISPAPNFAYAHCLDKIRDEELEGVDLSNWRTALNGAEMISPRVLREFADRFAKLGFQERALTPVYGLAEAALAVTFSALDEPPKVSAFDRAQLAGGRAVPGQNGRELVSVGRPVAGFAVEIRDVHGAVLEVGSIGAVWCRGPSLMREYLGLAEETDRILRDGWLDTGDLGFVYQGELYLTGRAKDTLVLKGRNFSPEEVEEAAADAHGVRESGVAAVTVLPAEASSEQLWLLVERQRRSSLPSESLAAEVRRAVSRNTGLRTEKVLLFETGTLPRTSSGKLRRRAALDAWLSGDLADLGSGSNPAPLSCSTAVEPVDVDGARRGREQTQ